MCPFKYWEKILYNSDLNSLVDFDIDMLFI